MLASRMHQRVLPAGNFQARGVIWVVIQGDMDSADVRLAFGCYQPTATVILFHHERRRTPDQAGYAAYKRLLTCDAASGKERFHRHVEGAGNPSYVRLTFQNDEREVQPSVVPALQCRRRPFTSFA